jgi:hypothetical protein
MASEIKVDTISEKTSAGGVTIDGLLIKDGGISGDVSLIGTTPTFTIGDAGAEDAALVFDGNAQDYYVGLDDSSDSLVLGLGSALGTTPAITINSSQVATFAQAPVFPDGSIAVADLNIDGGTDIGAALVDADEIIVDDGGGGTNRRCDMSRVKTYVNAGNAVTALNNATVNEIVTVGATTTELEAEANLTYNAATDPPVLLLEASRLEIKHTGDFGLYSTFNTNRGAAGDSLGELLWQWNGTAVAKIQARAGVDTTNKDDGSMAFYTTTSGGSITERMRITSEGVVGMGAVLDGDLGVGLHIKTADSGAGAPNADADELVIENSGSAGLTIYSGTSSAGRIMFGDSGNVANGFMSYNHSSNHLEFGASDTEHFRIASDGTLTATDTSIGSNSDSRIKENISDFTYDLAKFKQLQPRTFDWKNPSQHNGVGGNRGFIAQEVQAIDDYWIGELKLTNNHDDYSLLDSVTKNNCVIDNERIIASGISESDWETGKLNDTYPKDSTWKSSAEGDRVSLTSKLGKKDAMYISIIQQLITRIEALEG